MGEQFDADIEMLSDGGGRVRAALRPIVWRDKVVRLLLGLREREARSIRPRVVEINGEAAFVTITTTGRTPWSRWTVAAGR